MLIYIFVTFQDNTWIQPNDEDSSEELKKNLRTGIDGQRACQTHSKKKY